MRLGHECVLYTRWYGTSYTTRLESVDSAETHSSGLVLTGCTACCIRCWVPHLRHGSFTQAVSRGEVSCQSVVVQRQLTSTGTLLSWATSETQTKANPVWRRWTSTLFLFFAGETAALSHSTVEKFEPYFFFSHVLSLKGKRIKVQVKFSVPSVYGRGAPPLCDRENNNILHLTAPLLPLDPLPSLVPAHRRERLVFLTQHRAVPRLLLENADAVAASRGNLFVSPHILRVCVLGVRWIQVGPVVMQVPRTPPPPPQAHEKRVDLTHLVCVVKTQHVHFFVLKCEWELPHCERVRSTSLNLPFPKKCHFKCCSRNLAPTLFSLDTGCQVQQFVSSIVLRSGLEGWSPIDQTSSIRPHCLWCWGQVKQRQGILCFEVRRVQSSFVVKSAGAP